MLAERLEEESLIVAHRPVHRIGEQHNKSDMIRSSSPSITHLSLSHSYLSINDLDSNRFGSSRLDPVACVAQMLYHGECNEIRSLGPLHYKLYIKYITLNHTIVLVFKLFKQILDSSAHTSYKKERAYITKFRRCLSSWILHSISHHHFHLFPRYRRCTSW